LTGALSEQRRALVPSPNHLEALERQIFIDLVDQLQRGCDLPCLPAGGDDGSFLT
jgi:hypothetical protein